MRIGRVQKLVLLVLGDSHSSFRQMAYDHPYLKDHSNSLWGAVDGLARKGLLDVAGFDGDARTFKLTEKGQEVLRALTRGDETGASGD